NAVSDDRCNQPMASSHDLFRVKAREVGKVVNLGVNQPKERRELRRPNEAPKGPHELRERFRRGPRNFTELSLALLELTDDGVANDLAKQLFLVGEVEVDRTLGEPRALGDVIEPRGGE